MVESSIGHIRDMPDKAAEIPEKYRAQPWARLGVDVDNDFKALYVVPADKKQQVSKLKSLLKDADELYLATDEDREGEAIAWHLLEELKPKVPTRRMVFHEITPEAIARAIANPTELNDGKVDAYQTRRVLDRLYGYEVSPVLWKKVMPRLSAGRVQSVATRLIVDRERERIAFRSASYWDLEAEFATAEHGKERLPDNPTSFTATWSRSTATGSPRAATSRPWASCATSAKQPVLHLDGAAAAALAGRLQRAQASFEVSSVERKPYRRSPVRAVPHHHAAAGGHPQARLLRQVHDVGGAAAVRERLHHLYADRLDHAVADRDRRRPQPGPRAVRRRVRAGRAADLHQQGEERPGGARGDPPGRRPLPHPAGGAALRAEGDELRLYDLIWKRTVACQMKDATGESVSVRVAGTPAPPGKIKISRRTDRWRLPRRSTFDPAAVRRPSSARPARSSTSTGSSRPTSSPTTTRPDRDDQERRLPALAESDPLTALRLSAPSTPPGRRPATPRRAWSRSWRTGRSAARPPTRASSARSSTAATSSRRAPRWCRPSWRSR